MSTVRFRTVVEIDAGGESQRIESDYTKTLTNGNVTELCLTLVEGDVSGPSPAATSEVIVVDGFGNFSFYHFGVLAIQVDPDDEDDTVKDIEVEISSTDPTYAVKVTFSVNKECPLVFSNYRMRELLEDSELVMARIKIRNNLGVGTPAGSNDTKVRVIWAN